MGITLLPLILYLFSDHFTVSLGLKHLVAGATGPYVTAQGNGAAGPESGGFERGEAEINVGSLLSDEEKTVRDKVCSFVDEQVIPTAAEYWDKVEFPFDLLQPLGELGIMGGSFGEEYGCAGWSNVAYGLAIAELARGSGSLATFLHVQSGLAMAAIYKLGSEEQKQKWLPPMAKCEKVGCFGLTEPDAGSDPGSLATTAVERDGGYVLNGEKKWIGNASFADVAVIWARTEDEEIGCFLIEGDNPGYDAEVLPRKGSQRAAWQTHISSKTATYPPRPASRRRRAWARPSPC